MEYRKKGDENWISVPEGATEITELPAGEYEVRYKETEDKYASEPAVVTVTESDEPVVEPTAEPARKRGHSSRSSATPSPSPSPSASTSPITEPDATTEPSHGSGTPSLNTSDHFAYINGYLDGSFKPENKITRAEVAVIFAQLINDE
ncbi:MAG: S-layer homology domain-containing protein, partial [Clostridia bacterium]|nr:S-layer homology domain-containing protein [Clostridia bacterium]